MSNADSAKPTPTDKPLHRNLVPLDSVQHRQLKLAKTIADDYSPVAGINAMFVNAVELIDACREYPVVFVRSGQAAADGTPSKEVVPMAVLGLKRGENLYLDGKTWRARYVPAHLRAYPFALVRQDENNHLICFDRDWDGFSDTEGQPLFNEDGQPAELVNNLKEFLQAIDRELQRTRLFCDRLVELNVLQEMRFDAKMANGDTLVVDGFLAINEKAMMELPDATVAELHRQGILSLVYALMTSMGNMRQLVERRIALGLPA